MRNMLRGCVVVALVVGVLGSVATAGQDKPIKKTGTVVSACPEGRQLTFKCDGGQEGTYGVAEKAREQVKALEKDDHVQVTFVKCPKTGKLVVVGVKKCE